MGFKLKSINSKETGVYLNDSRKGKQIRKGSLY